MRATQGDGRGWLRARGLGWFFFLVLMPGPSALSPALWGAAEDAASPSAWAALSVGEARAADLSEPGEEWTAEVDTLSPAYLCSRGKVRMMREKSRLAALAEYQPTPNQLRYDVRHYDLSFDIEFRTPLSEAKIHGVTLIRLDVTEGPLDTLELNLSGAMVVDSVRVENTVAQFSHQTELLRIRLPRPFQTGESLTCRIRYAGHPGGDACVFQLQADSPFLWTLSEPFGARTWWPCKDYPEDKADSVEIRVKAPGTYLAASNGKLRFRRDDGINSECWWHESYPISTYLVSLAVYPYKLTTDWYVPENPAPGMPDSMELQFYNYPNAPREWQVSQAKIKTMITNLVHSFGEYPFIREKYGQAQFNWGGAMEHQTLTSTGTNLEGIAVHELAHQWWGDMITCKDFHDVWLNEGFATYSEALWAERQSGPAGYWKKIRGIAYFDTGSVYVPDLNDWGRIFSGDLSYNKGAWVLHMLRHVVGDEKFFQILLRYRERFEGGVASTSDFRSVAEEIHGRSLEPFFRQWVYGERYPIYSYSWTAAPGAQGWTMNLRLQQMQSWQIFTMPIDLVVTTPSGLDTLVVENSSADTTYTMTVKDEPVEVLLDPEQWILRKVLPPVLEATFSEPILVVNGFLWRSPADARIRERYEARALVGPYSFDFWDGQSAPVGGYPDNLPLPLGHGPIPGSVLGRYKTVIWVANNDPAAWIGSPVYSYLQQGGNVILLTGGAESFLFETYQEYLGIQLDPPRRVPFYKSVITGLPELVPVDTVSLGGVATFSPDLIGPSTLLYRTLLNGVIRGVGVYRRPGPFRPDESGPGGFAFISGRPDAWRVQSLRPVMDYLLNEMIGKKTEPVSLVVKEPHPSPTQGRASFDFYLNSPGLVKLAIWDVSGRRVSLLRNGSSPAGWNSEIWSGLDAERHPVGAGVYFVRLETPGGSHTSRVVVIP